MSLTTFRCLTTWLLQNHKSDQLDTAGLVHLFTSIFDKSPHHCSLVLKDKKLTKLVLRTVLKHVSSLKEEEEVKEKKVREVLVTASSLLGQLLPALASPKILQILQDFYTAERESLATAVAGSCSWQLEPIWLGWQLLVLGQLERQQPGGWRKQLGNQLLGPLVDWLAAQLGPGAEADPLLGEAVRDMARIGGEVVDLMDTNTLRKRLHKVRFISITEPLLVGFGIPNYAPASLFIILETPFLGNVAAK